MVFALPDVRYGLNPAVQPAFTCRLNWAPGTLAVWVNSSLLHAAINDYAGHRRVVYRTTVEGFHLEVAS